MLKGYNLDEFTIKPGAKSSVANPEQPFPRYLGQWEYYCLNQIKKINRKNGTTFFIGIDNYYVFEKKVHDKFGDFEGIPKDPNITYKNEEINFRTRGLAGFVCSIERLPMDALGLFPHYVEYVLKTELNPQEIHTIDELYLTYVLYKIMKHEGKLGFFVANYIQPTSKYICNHIKKPGFDVKDPFMYKVFSYECGKNENIPYIQMFYLKYPDLHLLDQAFYNPLKNVGFKHIIPAKIIGNNIIPHPVNNDYANKNVVFQFPLKQSYRKMKTRRQLRKLRKSKTRRN